MGKDKKAGASRVIWQRRNAAEPKGHGPSLVLLYTGVCNPASPKDCGLKRGQKKTSKY